ncbi:tRNA uridine-5-carboxymethylaminomethyl(34) synthesis GTPase MnmE [Babesia caballi]|uniref:tRNA uridine-5-carboxymethylaminomethyl(34) synthesis GTPase MnmE n=1 Tax=Babesia caballi TaxID=5871 RepID=A0AAV4LS66_BABCB|nr:tRNA uridine-5-carboxymethylaminomethyl(34) synthesis GTPase MnmE [Babesia caballi]
MTSGCSTPWKVREGGGVDDVVERTKQRVGRFLTNDAIAVLAAFHHFDKDNKEIREMLVAHIKEQRVYLQDEDYVERIQTADLSEEDKAELLEVETDRACEPGP